MLVLIIKDKPENEKQTSKDNKEIEKQNFIEDNFDNLSFYDYDLNYYSLDRYFNSGEGTDIFLNRIIREAVRRLKIKRNQDEVLEAYIKIGQCLYIQKKYDECAKCIEYAKKMQPNNPFVLFLKSELLVKDSIYSINNFTAMKKELGSFTNNNTIEAIKLINEFISIIKDYPPAYAQRAYLYCEFSFYGFLTRFSSNESIEAIGLNRKDIIENDRIATDFRYKAINDLQYAIKIDNNHSLIYHNKIADIYYDLGNHWDKKYFDYAINELETLKKYTKKHGIYNKHIDEINERIRVLNVYREGQRNGERLSDYMARIRGTNIIEKTNKTKGNSIVNKNIFIFWILTAVFSLIISWFMSFHIAPMFFSLENIEAGTFIGTFKENVIGLYSKIGTPMIFISGIIAFLFYNIKFSDKCELRNYILSILSTFAGTIIAGILIISLVIVFAVVIVAVGIVFTVIMYKSLRDSRLI